VQETFKASLLELLSEAYLGKTKDYTWFTGEQGVFGTLDGVSAEAASRSLGGASVAAHAEHLRWSLAMANAFARGEEPQADWSESWSVDRVDTEAWERLRAELRREFETLMAALEQRDLSTFDAATLTGILALAPHAAYHLGAMRQMVLAS
jgi:NAD(P)H-dependent FMN reductase